MDTLLTALRAAAEATRLRILALLHESEMTVGEIVVVLDQSQPRVSRHLKLLCDAGLLDRVKEGTQVFYRSSASSFSSRLLGALMDLIDPNDPMIMQDKKIADDLRFQRFEAAQAYFSAHAATWDEVRSLYVPEEQVEKALLELVGHQSDMTILDVGTGTGRMLELLAPFADKALGVDVSKDMLAVARSNLARQQLLNCQLQLGDMYTLPVEAASQDLIVFHQVLHFAEKPSAALAEAAKALNPGGRIIIADFERHDNEILREKHAHRRLGFTEEEITDWAKSLSLCVRKSVRLSGAELTVALWSLEFQAANRPKKSTQ